MSDLKALLKVEEGKKLIEKLLEEGKEIKILSGAKKICDVFQEEHSKKKREYEALVPEIIVFRKPYHDVNFIIRWLGEEKIRRGKKDPSAVLEEIKSLLQKQL